MSPPAQYEMGNLPGKAGVVKDYEHPNRQGPRWERGEETAGLSKQNEERRVQGVVGGKCCGDSTRVHTET